MLSENLTDRLYIHWYIMISGARSFPFKTVHFNCLLYYKLISCFEELFFSSPTSWGGRKAIWWAKIDSGKHNLPIPINCFPPPSCHPEIAILYPSLLHPLFLLDRSALDLKHDKQERIVKLSRDITAESKKIIFLLHRITWWVTELNMASCWAVLECWFQMMQIGRSWLHASLNMVSTFIWWKKSVEVLGWWRFSKTRCRWPALLSTPLSRGGKSDVSVCPKVLNEQFGQRDIGVTVLSVTCATERALNGAAVVLFPLFTELGQRNRSKLSEFMDRLPLQWLAILSGSTGTGMV